MKQLTTQTTYRLVRGNTAYAVTLTTIQNDVNGNPRYEASVTNLSTLANCGSAGAFRYRFTGHYFGEVREAEFILDRHLEKASGK